MRRLIGFVGGMIFLFGLAGSAQAEDGVMNSMSFQAIPENTKLRVEPLDNSDENIALQAKFEDALRDRGFTISPEANLVLTFETRDEIGAWTTTDRRHVLELKAKGGREGGEKHSARINFYNSQSGGVFNKGSGGTSITTPSEYRIDATIEDSKTGKRWWQGWSVAKLGAWDGRTLTEKMIPVIVDGIGKTIRKEPFEIR